MFFHASLKNEAYTELHRLSRALVSGYIDEHMWRERNILSEEQNLALKFRNGIHSLTFALVAILLYEKREGKFSTAGKIKASLAV